MRAQAGPYRAGDVADACGGLLLHGDADVLFEGICTDSREIRKNDLFVALHGPNFDGNQFVLPALEAGARGSLVTGDINRGILQFLSNQVLIQVQDTLPALSDLASAHRKIYPYPLVAVTGSSGKTTVKEMIAAVLGRSHRPLVSAGNFNNMIGLPMTVLNLCADHTIAVVEAGINLKGEMSHLARAASPSVAVITTIGPVHLEGLGTIENVAHEKFDLVRALPANGAAILPQGSPYIEPLLADCPCPAHFFGVEIGDFRAEGIKMEEETSFQMITPSGKAEIRLKVPGRHNIANALAAAASCMAAGVSLDDAVQGLNDFVPPTWRMERLPLGDNRVLIRDCYNANPQSMKAALEVLAHSGGSHMKLALLADMKELGDRAAELHEELGQEAAIRGIDRVLFVGGYGPSVADGFIAAGGNPESITCVQDKESAWDAVKADINQYGAILVKGSRAMRMETLAQAVLEEN